jgi:hypothetical protein
MNAISRIVLVASIIASAVAPDISAQQPPAAYPSKGQSPETQAADRSACMSWAQSNAPQQAVPPPQTGPAVGGGQRVAGAARGAAAGAVIGGVAHDDAGHGAGVGAAAGVVAGGVRARHARAAQNEASANAQAQNNAAYSQAYGACMKGRGYTMN